MPNWIQKIKGYDALVAQLQIARNDAERAENEKNHALDLCGRFEDDLKAAHREIDAMAYNASSRNKSHKKEIQNLKSKINKSKANADKKLLAEVKDLSHKLRSKEHECEKLQAKCETLRAAVEKAERLEWQYNTAIGQWEPVHGNLEDIQNHVPWPMVQFKEVRLDK